jgi:type I restriction enzyme M protein
MPGKRVLVSEVFELGQRGKSRYTRAYMQANPGTYPVYSAATTGPVGHVDTFDFEGQYLSWSTNGYAGRTMVLDGRFSMNADRAILRPKAEGLDLEYCAIALGPVFQEAARGRRQDDRLNEYTKLSPAEALKLEFEIPEARDGRLDVDAQKAHVRKWKQTHSFQARAKQLETLLSNVVLKPAIPDGRATIEVSLIDESRFSFIRRMETGWAKKQWREFATGDAGDTPVYTAARGPVAYVSVVSPKLIEASPDRPMLSFAVDGDGSAGSNLVVHRSPFYIATKRSCFELADEHIDIDFVYFSLLSMKSDHGFDYNYKAYRAHLEDVVVTVPVTDEGVPDLALQRELAGRLSKLGTLRDGVVDALAAVHTARVTVA